MSITASKETGGGRIGQGGYQTMTHTWQKLCQPIRNLWSNDCPKLSPCTTLQHHFAPSLAGGHAENLTSVQKLRHIPREPNAGDCQVLHSSCLGGRPFGREIWAAQNLSSSSESTQILRRAAELGRLRKRKQRSFFWSSPTFPESQQFGSKKKITKTMFFFSSFFKAICNPTYSSRNLSLRRSSQINLRISSGCLTWTLITFCWLPWGNLLFVWFFFLTLGPDPRENVSNYT